MIYIELFIKEFFYLLIEMAPWLLLGFFFAGLLHVYMPEKKIRKYMGGKNIKSVINAAILGIPLPLCSCGVIPTGIAFHKEGASKGSTVSFLISTPQTGVDSILVTYSLLGLPFAVLRPIVAFFSGIFGGAITNWFDKNNNEDKKPLQQKTSAEKTGSGGKLIRMIKYAFHDFMMDIAKWLIIGLAVAAFISLVLPDDFFTMYIGNEYISMLVVLLAAIPIYVCATGSVPIAAVLMMKGLSPGAALVFLMAGPATNTATMAVIGKAIDKKTLIVYLGTIIFSAFFFGALTNNIIPREWFSFVYGSGAGVHQHELLPYWLRLTSGIILILLILNGYIMQFFRKDKQMLKTTTEIKSDKIKMVVGVSGMTCNHCKANVEKNLSAIDGINYVNANHQTSEVIIEGDNVDLDLIKKTVEDIGYNYNGRKE